MQSLHLTSSGDRSTDDADEHISGDHIPPSFSWDSLLIKSGPIMYTDWI